MLATVEAMQKTVMSTPIFDEDRQSTISEYKMTTEDGV